MSQDDLRKLALKNVTRDFTCGFCSELCKTPATFNKCFHMICFEHFEDLKNCPICNITVEGCKIFGDTRLDSVIASTTPKPKLDEENILAWRVTKFPVLQNLTKNHKKRKISKGKAFESSIPARVYDITPTTITLPENNSSKSVDQTTGMNAAAQSVTNHMSESNVNENEPDVRIFFTRRKKKITRKMSVCNTTENAADVRIFFTRRKKKVIKKINKQ